VSDPARAIENLVFTYAELIDAGDFDAVGDLLADAVVGAIGETGGLRGRDQVASLFHATTKRHDDGTPLTKHVTTNLIVDVDDDATSASARSYFTVLQSVPGHLPLQPVVAGRYHDRFEWRGDRWRFTERRFAVDLVGDVSRHLTDGVLDTR
jgi:3-phenylpropionate/cinnamic acid dioxygenase small subunit